MKTARERDNERRKEKLKEMRRQIADGTLVVRQMTAKEKAACPPPRAKKRKSA
jgi:hypothetical protein